MDLHEQLALQMEQEAQMCRELETLVNRFAEEYAVTKYQVAAVLEEQKLQVMGFKQLTPRVFELLDEVEEHIHG